MVAFSYKWTSMLRFDALAIEWLHISNKYYLFSLQLPSPAANVSICDRKST